jgi:predicted ATPase/DNA-binding XRE family transcriptional regulator
MDSGSADFGTLLRQYRLASGVTQERLAEQARISVAAVGSLERGIRRAPHRETVALLAEALSLSGPEKAGFETAAEHARARQARADPTGPAHGNLPTRLTTFVGRDNEIAEIEALLKLHRLVTITGSGGVGKTRVAVEVSRRLQSDQQREIRFVDLSAVSDGAFVAGTIATTLGVGLGQADNPLPSLAAQVKARRLLLVLDNCEHVIEDSAAATSAILRACPDVVILATSRDRLSIEGECSYRMPSLFVPEQTPATPEAASEYPSFRLFVDRALAGDPHFVLTTDRLAAVAEICRRLEGIPLAIELAVTRLPTLGLNALVKRLQEPFPAPRRVRDLPHRQQTMHATIAWSYALLSAPEQMFLRRLSIFRGGLTLEAAEDVCADESIAARSVSDLLSSLVDKSLLEVTLIGEESRYRMLDSVHFFASEKLIETGEFTAMARTHAQWMATLAEHAHETFKDHSISSYVTEFGAEIDNARGALDWALNDGTDEDALLAARIVGGLRLLWVVLGRQRECLRWAEAAVKRTDPERHPLVAARLMRAYVQLVSPPARLPAARRAIPVFERLGDRSGLLALYFQIAEDLAKSGAFAEAEESIARAFELADELGWQRSRAYVALLQMRFATRCYAGRFSDARLDLAKSAALEDALGDRDASARLRWQAYLEFADGSVEKAEELLESGTSPDLPDAANPLNGLDELAATRLVRGKIDAAEATARTALEFSRFDGLWDTLGPIQHLATVAALRGRSHTAARLLGFVNAKMSELQRIRTHFHCAGHDILVASLRKQLSADAIEKLVAEGAALDLDRAVDEALNLG